MFNAPFPVSQRLKDRESAANGVFLAFVWSIALGLIPTGMVSYVVSEKERNLKHQQVISGLSLLAYWVTNYVYDFVKSLFICVLGIGLVYAWKLDDNMEYFWALLLLFPTGIIGYSYVSAFLFTKENGSQNFTILHHFFVGGMGSIAVFVLRIIDSTKTVGKILFWVFKIVPTFCVCNGIASASARVALENADNTTYKATDLLILGGDLIFLALHSVVWVVVLLLIEWGMFDCLKPKGSKINYLTGDAEKDKVDDDVQNEEERVTTLTKEDTKVRVSRLHKVYKACNEPTFLAVRNVSFALDYGECFALLGVNGAGKTTTFKSLTSDVVPTEGTLSICGFDVRTQFEEARQLIGYCPQFDSIFDTLTVQEHLEFYAKIKGIVRDKREALIKEQILKMDLTNYADKPAGTLSGGNKRKLSVAMAMIGNPPIVFLDEPSTGMDPQARRFMWNIISDISTKRQKSAVILTTHSMEEAEALSTKMGIMVKGLFKCLGSS